MVGRKRIDTEIRDKKVTVTLTKTVFNDLKDLSHIKRVSVASLLADLITQEAEKEAERLQAFRSI